jgi:hypothetical protein
VFFLLDMLLLVSAFLSDGKTLRRWVTGVNNWGRLGTWEFDVCRDPALIPRQIAALK